jgi:hypothetical protein
VLQGQRKLSEIRQSNFHRQMTAHQKRGVFDTLSQAQDPLGQLARGLQLRPHHMKSPEPPQHLEDLRRLA